MEDHPVLGVVGRGEVVEIFWRGSPISARRGEPIAAALWAAGVVVLGRSEVNGAPRGMFCAIGHCMACRVNVDGVQGMRACLTPIVGGERVEPC